MRHQRATEPARQRAARGVAEEHDDDQRGAHAQRRHFGIQRNGVGDHAGNAEAAAEPCQLQLIERMGVGAGQVGDAEHQSRIDDGRASAEAVAEPAEQRRAKQHAEIIGRQHRAEIGRLHAPFLDQRGYRDAGGDNVPPIEQHDHEGPEDDVEGEEPDPLAVHDVVNADDCLSGHDPLPAISHWPVGPGIGQSYRRDGAAGRRAECRLFARSVPPLESAHLRCAKARAPAVRPDPGTAPSRALPRRRACCRSSSSC